MPANEKTVLKVHGNGDLPVSEIAGFLSAFDNAYNGALIFVHTLDRVYDLRHEFPFPMRHWPFIWPTLPLMGPGRSRRSISLSQLSPESELSGWVAVGDRVILKSVLLASPGMWEFLGNLNPLEVIRQYLKDRHERRKDREFREAAERRRMFLENEIAMLQVVQERIKMARSLGATDRDLAPLLNLLLVRPLRALDQYQDREVIVEMDGDDGLLMR